MVSHEVIEIGSVLWWKGFSLTVLVISGLLYLALKMPARGHIIRIIAGWILIAVAILIHPFLIYTGQWNLQTSLPLNLCSLSGILSGIVLLKRNQLAYELLLYWGLPA